MTFYEDMVALEKQRAADLETFEKRCEAFVPWLLERVCLSLGWPVEQFKRVRPPDPAADADPKPHPTPNGYIDAHGYAFSFAVDMWGRWSATFHCSVTASAGGHFAVSGVGPRSSTVAENDATSLGGLVEAVKATIQRTCRDANWAAVTTVAAVTPAAPAAPAAPAEPVHSSLKAAASGDVETQDA